MNTPQPPKIIRFLADEFHSESWSVSVERAREISPEDPLISSYQKAGDALAARDFTVSRNTSEPLTQPLLANADVLALVHPCDPHWERTTSANPPSLSNEEVADILKWVNAGGGLLIITEYEHDKYGDNLNKLLEPLGLKIENGKVFDRTACVAGNTEWILAEPVPDSPLGHLAKQACFYRAGWCAENHGAEIGWRSSSSAHPPHAGLIGMSRYGEGRVAVVTDSVIFGDERIGEYDNLQVWLNLVHWLAAPAYRRYDTSRTNGMLAPENSGIAGPWQKLKTNVNTLRKLQRPDGSATPDCHDTISILLDEILRALSELAPQFPHQAAYFSALTDDLQKWKQTGFEKPDFGASLEVFRPDQHRTNGILHLILFPMYTPNASLDTRFETMLVRTPWPDWLDHLERTAYGNPKFVPGQLVDFTDGYASECAVLFPETISLAGRPSNHFGVIFCDRESARLQSCALRSASATGMALFPELECLLSSRLRLEETCALWDLIHDQSHSRGELPFDPFMIRQRSPFWMYGIEELRVDVQAFCEADRLAREGFPFARNVCYAIILDRIFRFPLTGSRVRNYDALGGQFMFSYLHQKDVVLWRDNHLVIDWARLPAVMLEFRTELHALYKSGADCSKLAFWIAAHDLVARFVRPNVASHWKAEAITDENDPKQWLNLIHDDEFPLGNFHLNLQRRLKSV